MRSSPTTIATPSAKTSDCTGLLLFFVDAHLEMIASTITLNKKETVGCCDWSDLLNVAFSGKEQRHCFFALHNRIEFMVGDSNNFNPNSCG